MESKIFYLSFGVLLSIGLAFASSLVVVSCDDSTTNDEVNLSSDQIAKLRGFDAQNHYVTSKDGYIINVVRIAPVRKTNKRPVLFNHGSTQSSTYFMTNSVGARPKDWSNLDASSMSINDLEALLINEPNSKCMPLLLASCGHEVWLINRRGTEFSLGKVSLTEDESPTQNVVASLVGGLVGRLASKDSSSLDDQLGEQLTRQNSENTTSYIPSLIQLLLKPQLNLDSIANTLNGRYWNFSLDEQAIYDIPPIVQYVLEKTGSKKIAYIGHSLGNGLMFMLQSEQPEYGDVIEPFLAWSPDFYLGHTTSILRPLLVSLQPILSAALIPFPPTPVDPLTRTLLALLCQTSLAQATICRFLDNSMFGFSGDQQETKPAFVASQFYSISSHEAVQLAQDAEKGKMHHYDYMDETRNLRAYGTPKAPIYNVSRITSKSISLWHGGDDALATPIDVKILISDLRVPVDDRFIQEVPFSHYDLLFGKNVSNLVNIPSLKLIESYM